MFELYFSDPGRLNGEVDRLRGVSAADVRRFAAERLGPTNRAVLTYRPRAAS